MKKVESNNNKRNFKVDHHSSYFPFTLCCLKYYLILFKGGVGNVTILCVVSFSLLAPSW